NSSDEEAEARVDYIADQLGIKLERTIRIINAFREMGILADEADLSAFVRRSETHNKITAVVERFSKIESYLIVQIEDVKRIYNLKEPATDLENNARPGNASDIKAILLFWGLRKLIDLRYEDGSKHHIAIQPRKEFSDLRNNVQNRQFISQTIANYLVDES